MLFLVLCFFNGAVLWLLIEAEFLAIVLVLVYVGAVMVLFLFVVMMLDINIEKLREGFARNAPLGDPDRDDHGGRARLRRVGPAPRPSSPGAAAASLRGPSNTREIGAVLYTKYVYPFQLAAMVLLIAIVAAIAADHAPAPGHEGAGHRAGRSRCAPKTACRLVNMPAEREPMIALAQLPAARRRAVRHRAWRASSSTART